MMEERGLQVWVKILEVRDDPGGNLKINCSARAVDQESGQDLDPDNRLAGGGGGGRGYQDGPLKDEPPPLGSIHRANVATIKPFGVFVRIQGFRINGLVHLSQVIPLGTRGTPARALAGCLLRHEGWGQHCVAVPSANANIGFDVQPNQPKS